MPKTLLEKLEAVLGGPIVAFDGKYVVWFKTEHRYMQQGTRDLRDVMQKIKGITLATLIEALPSFDKPKRAKVAITESEE